MRPNILLIVLDAARADHFEPYGAQAGSTPVIADLARRGGHVPYAYAAGSWTVPSHAALFSGLLPRQAGLSRAPGRTPASCEAPLRSIADRLLAPVLRGHGYETRAISTNAWLLPHGGFDSGFERFELVDPGRHVGAGSKGVRNAARTAAQAARAKVDDGASDALQLLSGWTAEPRDRPFFWFVNLVEAHSPYLPPRPWNSLGLRDRVTAAAEARRYLSLNAIWQSSLGVLEVPGEAVERMRRLYADSVRYLDFCVEKALSDLERAGILDDTIVIVTADHGENLGEAGMLGHSFSLDDRLLRVPFISAGPVQIAEGRLMSLVDVPRRIGDAIGLEGHPWEGSPHRDIALAQFDPPTGPGDPRNEELLRLWGLEDPHGTFVRSFTTPLSCAVDGRHKLVRKGEREEWFDLEADPLEERPLSPMEGSREAVDRLRAALHRAEERPAPDAPAAPDPGNRNKDEVDDLEERMRLLGYL